MQNFGSKPQIVCNTITEIVITIGFLYFDIIEFITYFIILEKT